jgi:hypothetical protein
MAVTALILASRSWGELGNLNAAKRLAEALHRSTIRCEPVVHAIEEFYTPFEQYGSEIEDIKQGSHTADQVRTRYSTLMKQIAERFPRDFETQAVAAEAPQQLRELGGFLMSSGASVIIATKGFISRLAICAMRMVSSSILPVINYVTNEGLLGFDIHIARSAFRHTVPSDYGAQLLMRAGVREAVIRVVGPLVAVSGNFANIEDREERQHVGVLINRGGHEYWPLLRALAGRGSAICVTVVCVGADFLATRLRLFCPPHWTLLSKLPAGQYLDLLEKMACSRSPLLICKAGPNTVLESVAAHIPVVALRSGLPQEDWVSDRVKNDCLGISAESPYELADQLSTLLDSPDALNSLRTRVREFAAARLRRDKAEANIAAVLAEVLKLRTHETAAPCELVER